MKFLLILSFLLCSIAQAGTVYYPTHGGGGGTGPTGPAGSAGAAGSTGMTGSTGATGALAGPSTTTNNGIVTWYGTAGTGVQSPTGITISPSTGVLSLTTAEDLLTISMPDGTAGGYRWGLQTGSGGQIGLFDTQGGYFIAFNASNFNATLYANLSIGGNGSLGSSGFYFGGDYSTGIYHTTGVLNFQSGGTLEASISSAGLTTPQLNVASGSSGTITSFIGGNYAGMNWAGNSSGGGYIEDNRSQNLMRFAGINNNGFGVFDSGPIGIGTISGSAASYELEVTQGTGVTVYDALTIGEPSTTPQHSLNTSTATPASGVLTMTNAPTGVSGNPAGYVQITINGTTHYMPYW